MEPVQPITRESTPVSRELQAFTDRFPESAELVESNPALALCLAQLPAWDTAFEKDDHVSITRGLILGKRREACAFLGFPGTEAVSKLLAKIPESVCHLPHLLRVRRVLHEQPGLIKLLAHLPVLDEATVFLAAHWRWNDYVTLSLFRQLAAECQGKELPSQSWLLDDTLKLAERMGHTKRHCFGSIREIRRYHDRLVNELNTAEFADFTSEDCFPPPPKMGTAQIIPLDQPRLLTEEGLLQHNCVAVYESDVDAGNRYFYRILKPERATLCLAKNGTQWVIQELKAACNAEVTPATRKAVTKWLASEETA